MQVLTTASGQIEFLHILTDGAVGQSYGVKVAELAGLPKEIILRAADLLKQLEVSNPGVKQPDAKINQLSLFEFAPKFLLPQPHSLRPFVL